MNSFEILNTEKIYQGRVFTLDKIEVKLPDGKTRAFDLVRHPGAVVLIPIDEQNRVLFVRQYRLGAGHDLLELPAGTLEPDEDPADCAAREIREETGMAAKNIERIGGFFMAPGYSSEYLHIYLATGLYPDRLQGDEDEFIQNEAIPVDKVFEMIQTGEMDDGKTLAAFALAAKKLRSE